MLQVENLVKVFTTKRDNDVAQVRAIDDVSFNVQKGEMFTLLGPSGCGKTTTLRSIAGLEFPDGGKIRVDGRMMFSGADGIRVKPNERGLGMVFQSYAIWPHMNVFENVAFPLKVGKRRGLSRAQISERVERVLAVVQLDKFAGRPATDLSGGQQQRLALARALVMEPPVMLLDEPLSNLDAKLRENMRFELKRLQRDVGITAIYVTHDQTEAMSMSSAIAVMNRGRIEQIGKPWEIYNDPVSKFVADFIGTANFLEGQVVGTSGTDRFRIQTACGPVEAHSSRPLDSSEVFVSIRPENVTMTSLDRPAANDWEGIVDQRAFLGEAVDHLVRFNGAEFRVRTNPSAALTEGTPVRLEFPKNAAVVMPRADT